MIIKGYKGTTRENLKVGLDTTFEVALFCSKIYTNSLKIIVEFLKQPSMLKAISWQEYFVFISVILIVYYIFLFIFYFRVNFSSLLRGSCKTFFRGKELDREMSGNAEKVIHEIRPVFPGKQNIHELIYALQTKLEPYKHWDEPGFRENINAFICKESEKNCSIHLSEEELKAVWI